VLLHASISDYYGFSSLVPRPSVRWELKYLPYKEFGGITTHGTQLHLVGQDSYTTL